MEDEKVYQASRNLIDALVKMGITLGMKQDKAYETALQIFRQTDVDLYSSLKDISPSVLITGSGSHEFSRIRSNTEEIIQKYRQERKPSEF